MWFLCLALKTVGPQWQSHNNSNTVGSRHDILLRISCLDPHLILTIHCPHDTGGIHQRNLLKFQIFIGSFHFWHLSEWRNSKLRLVVYPIIYLLLFIPGRFCIWFYIHGVNFFSTISASLHVFRRWPSFPWTLSWIALCQALRWRNPTTGPRIVCIMSLSPAWYW